MGSEKASRGSYPIDRLASAVQAIHSALIRDFADDFRQLRFRRRELLLHQGDPAREIFLIEYGSVVLFRTNALGATIGLDWIGPKGVCGLEEAIFDCTYEASARASTETLTLRLFSAPLRLRIRTNPEWARCMQEFLSAKLTRTIECLELLTLANLEDRVHKTLCYLLERLPQQDPPISIPLTQSDLADLAGASRQRVNQVLTHLHRLGIVDSSRREIVIRDPLRLLRFEYVRLYAHATVP